MSRARKPDAIKNCKTCGILLSRKRMPNGDLESNFAFNKRNYCCLSCANTKTTVKDGQYRRRASKYRKLNCENCESTENLQIHHIDNNIKNNDLSNLQTLCSTCHMKLHWQQGKKIPKKSVCIVCQETVSKIRLGMCSMHYQRFKKNRNTLFCN